MLKKTISILMAAALGLSLAACGGGSSDSAKTDETKQDTTSTEEKKEDDAAADDSAKPADGEKVKIGITLYSLKNEFTVRLANAAQAKCDELGIELEVYDGNYDASTQISQVETMIENGVQGIILNPQDADALAVAVEKANAANIPIVGVNTRVNSDGLTSYVGSKDVMAGELEMQMIADILGGKGEIVIIEGPLGQSAQIERKEGIYNILEKYPDIKVLAEKTGNWSRAEGMTLMDTWLNTFDKIDAIVAENDEMALGAYQAAKAKGFTEMPAIGVDGITDALNAVKNGEMVATIFQDGWGQGQKATEVLYDAIQGKPVETEYWIDFETVTKDNVEEYMTRAQ